MDMQAPPPAEDRPDTPPARPTVEFYRAEDFPTEESIGYLVRRVVTSLTQEIDDRLGEHDLTNAQWVPLYKIAAGVCNTATELSRVCQADAGAMTRMLDRLEAKGLLKRERSTSDRRVVNVALTEEGARAASRVPAVLAAASNALLSGFTREEWETLKRLLRRMVDNADALKGQSGE